MLFDVYLEILAVLRFHMAITSSICSLHVLYTLSLRLQNNVLSYAKHPCNLTVVSACSFLPLTTRGVLLSTTNTWPFILPLITDTREFRSSHWPLTFCFISWYRNRKYDCLVLCTVLHIIKTDTVDHHCAQLCIIHRTYDWSLFICCCTIF